MLLSFRFLNRTAACHWRAEKTYFCDASRPSKRLRLATCFDVREHQFLHCHAVGLGMDFPNVAQQELGGMVGFLQSFPFALVHVHLHNPYVQEN